MRLNLVTHPKVMRIAEALVDSSDYRDWAGLHYGIPGFPPADTKQDRYDALRVTRYVTVGALLRYWGYVHEHIEDDDTIQGLWPDDVDQIAGVPGFCGALQSVGWLVFGEREGSVRVPNFNKYNVLSPNRGLSMTPAERQKAYRERLKLKRDAKRDVTLRNNSDAREDKNREDKRTKEIRGVAALPDWLPREPWDAWLEVRKKNRAPNTARALNLALRELERLRGQGHDPAEILETATMRGWRGLFPPSKANSGSEAVRVDL
jgi:hypothetical protein